MRLSPGLLLSLTLFVTPLVLAGCGGGGGGGGITIGGGGGGGGGSSEVTRTYALPGFGGAQVATAMLSYDPAATSGPAVSSTVSSTNPLAARAGTAAETPAAVPAAEVNLSRDMPPDVQAVEDAAREQANLRLRTTGPELESVRPRFDETVVPEGGDLSFYIATTGQSVTCRKMHADADTTDTYVFAQVVAGTPVINKATALAIDARFGTNNPFDPNGTGIGPRVRNTFGNEWRLNGGRDGETKVVMVLLSSNGIGGAGLYGFFRPNDEYSKAQVGTSNEGEILYMNATYFQGDMYDGLATTAHEFQHMCNFNQKFVRDGAFTGTDELDTLNEGQSVLAEEVTGFNLSSVNGGNSFLFACARAYLQNPQTYPFFTFANANADYGKGYLFHKYLYDRFGAQMTHTIAASTGIGRENIESATGQPFATLFREWGLANLLDPVVGTPAVYTYPGLVLEGTYTIRGMGSVVLPSAAAARTFSPPEGTATLSLGAWTNTYVRYSGGTGSTLTTTVTLPAGTNSNMVLETPAEGTYGSVQ